MEVLFNKTKEQKTSIGIIYKGVSVCANNRRQVFGRAINQRMGERYLCLLTGHKCHFSRNRSEL